MALELKKSLTQGYKVNSLWGQSNNMIPIYSVMMSLHNLVGNSLIWKHLIAAGHTETSDPRAWCEAIMWKGDIDYEFVVSQEDLSYRITECTSYPGVNSCLLITLSLAACCYVHRNLNEFIHHGIYHKWSVSHSQLVVSVNPIWTDHQVCYLLTSTARFRV